VGPCTHSFCLYVKCTTECTTSFWRTLYRSPNAFVSTPLVLQNSLNVLSYTTEVHKFFQSPYLNTNCTTKFFQGYALHYRGPQMLPEPKTQHQLHYKFLSRFCPTLKRSPNAMKAFSQHQLHYKILSRLCTTLQRSPNASRAPISTPTALQNSFKVLPYITKVPKCHKSLSLNTKCTKKCITKFCPTLERSQNDSKACVSTPSA
jgi:hypothetical protein